MNAKKNFSAGNIPVTQHPDYKTEILSIIRSNLAPRLMRERVLDYHENDIAAAMELMRREERAKLYSILDTASLADVLESSRNTSAS